MEFYLIVGLLLLVGFYYMKHRIATKQKIKSRADSDLSDLVSLYNSTVGGIDEDQFVRSLGKVSEFFSIPVEKIRLNDVIGEDLGAVPPFSMIDSAATEDFYEHIYEEKEANNIAYDEKIVTVSDFIKFENFIYRNLLLLDNYGVSKAG